MTNRLYLENPYLKEIEARVVDKIYIDGKYYITLNRTIFYPHLSGGQPGDKGNINGIEVVEVYEEGSNIIHVIKENIHSDKVSLNIDWENRLDNMQQHTGQHLLSASFYKLYNGETVGFHIGKDYVYIDVTLPELSEDEVRRIEIYTNRIISLNFPIKSYFVEKNDMNKLPIRQQPAANSNIRIVEIENIDFSPCSGSHLRSTGEIGLIKVRKWEKYKGMVRIEFICGNRALYDYDWKNKAIKDISLLLSSKDKDVYNKVQILFNQKEELTKENRYLKEELYRYRADELLNTAFKIDNISFVSGIFDDMDLKDMSTLASHLNNTPSLVQLLGAEVDDKAHFIVSRSQDIHTDLKNILANICQDFNIKGGGSPNKVQGSCSFDDLEQLLNIFANEIKASL